VLSRHRIIVKIPNPGVVVAENCTQSHAVQLPHVDTGFFHVLPPTPETLNILLLHFPDDKHASDLFELASMALVGEGTQVSIDVAQL
jgi:hypothetical protein